MGSIAIGIILLVGLQNFLSPKTPLGTGSGAVRYVPLGDSYTFGEKVDKKDAWPELLVRDLNSFGIKTTIAANPSRMGWATKEVLSKELPILEASSPTFVTVLIGTNDFNQGVSETVFQKNLEEILDRTQQVLPDPTKIILLTIPDFSVTPKGKTFGDPKFNSQGVARWNQIILMEGAKRGLPVVDIYPLSQQMANDESLVASDGLHPSAKEYRLWEKEILPVARGLLK